MKLLVVCLSLVSGAAAQTSFKFDFTASKPAPYSAEKGYGLEEGSDIAAPPYYFSVSVPEEGNYKVTVKLGDRDAAAVATEIGRAHV